MFYIAAGVKFQKRPNRVHDYVAAEILHHQKSRIRLVTPVRALCLVVLSTTRWLHSAGHTRLPPTLSPPHVLSPLPACVRLNTEQAKTLLQSSVSPEVRKGK